RLVEPLFGVLLRRTRCQPIGDEAVERASEKLDEIWMLRFPVVKSIERELLIADEERHATSPMARATCDESHLRTATRCAQARDAAAANRPVPRVPREGKTEPGRARQDNGKTAPRQHDRRFEAPHYCNPTLSIGATIHSLDLAPRTRLHG